MSKYSINDTTLDNIAAPIMSMRGLTGGLTPEEMGTNANAVMANVTDALTAIAAKGVDVSGMNSDNLAALIDYLVKLPTLTTPGAAADLRTGKQLIDGSGNIVTGTMPEQAAQTITPGTSNKTIASGRYLTGTQTIKGDSNLVAANIASGKTIFGVTGTFSGGGKAISGSLTCSDTQTSVTVTHNLGEVPNIAVALNESVNVRYPLYMGIFYVYYKGTKQLVTIATSSTLKLTTSSFDITSSGTGFGSATENDIIYKPGGAANSSSTQTIYYVLGVV